MLHMYKCDALDSFISLTSVYTSCKYFDANISCLAICMHRLRLRLRRTGETLFVQRICFGPELFKLAVLGRDIETRKTTG